MKSQRRNLAGCSFFLFVVLLGAAHASEPAVTLTLQYQRSDTPWIADGAVLFGQYLGSGDGVAAGKLNATVVWDLYEDQSRDDLHPAHFRGLLEMDGIQHPFQILGVYTPTGTERVVTPGGHETLRYWTLSGTVVFEDTGLLGVRHATITGKVDTGVGRVVHAIWLDHTVE